MHPILEEFLEKWVWPTGAGAPGAKFRLRLTRKCLPGWEGTVKGILNGIQKELDSGSEEWKKRRAYSGYAIEGIQMSINQMCAQLLSVDIGDQEQYINLQRTRARQIWDECKHSKLHVDVLLENGWIKNERELMEIVPANTQHLNAYFGLSHSFENIHPMARAGQHYYNEAIAVLGIEAHLALVDDPMVRHENLSQRDEERMHFLQGKFQIDYYCTTPELERVVEDSVDWLMHQARGAAE